MTLFLQRPELELLAKLCGLFSSHHDGERASAAAKADALVRQLGTTSAELLVTRWNSRQKSATWADTVESKLGTVLACPEPLTSWERRFVSSINGQRRLSLKQRDLLDRLYRKAIAYYEVKNGGRQ
jgi:hypothetical protein